MSDNKKQWIKIIRANLTPPSLRDNSADVDRLISWIKKELGTKDVEMDFSFVRKIPGLLRKHQYRLKPVLYKKQSSWALIDILSPQENETIFGLAMDLGTTTIVLRLLDLMKGDLKDEISFNNPQIEIGQDILTRIHYAGQEGGLERLQGIVIDRLNREISGLIQKHGIGRDSIVGMVGAGNTTMTHLFLGLDPFSICREPYAPAINSPGQIKAKKLDIEINPGAPILMLPSVGSYFGGDLIAGILASGINNQEEVSILVDVGTNAEVVIGNRDWLMACAGAAGPALEGGVAGMGMMAGPGVINMVNISPDTRELSIKTIGDNPPMGICGSGLIDLVAQLFLAGMIDLRGKFAPKNCNDYMRDIDGIKHFVVVRSQESATGKPLTLSQPEIDSLMRSKAAMYTILTTITNTAGIAWKEISNFYIAGTFGLYVDPKSAITIGMIPDLPLTTYKPLGNTSLAGAQKVLMSSDTRNEAKNIRDRITYIELNVNQEFMNNFSAAKFIPHTDRGLFPSVREYTF